ncbi:MAG: HAD hydrolase family protein [Pseudomonadota bacterium]
MQESADLIVFSDLDGTLLDHHSYRWDAATPALTALADRGALLVLSSSKTAAEIEVLQDEIGLPGAPAIVENGAGVIGLPSHPQSDGVYDELRAALEALPAQLRAPFEGFGDISARTLAQRTGLSVDAAIKAKARRFSEPGHWHGDAATRTAFLEALGAKGFIGRQGGRFLTLSKGRTKADAMADLVAFYRPKHTLALGDAPNDIEMLEAADHGVIVANPDGPDIPRLEGEGSQQIRRTTLPGPAGWSNAVLEWLAHLPPR